MTAAYFLPFIRIMYTDTHTHIYDEAFDADRGEMISRALDAGIDRLFLPAIDSTSHEKMSEVVAAFPSVCFPMMGLHPTSVDENFQQELEVVSAYLERPDMKFYAVGEIGVDLYWDKTHETEQLEVFRVQLQMASFHQLPVVIHTRNAMDKVLDVLEKEQIPGLRGIFHCFSGSLDQARRATKSGFFLGIGGVVTYKSSGLQQVVAVTGLEHLVLETDAPWLPPVPHRGHRNEPAYLPLIAAAVARIKGTTPEEVARQTTSNALTLFGV